MQEQEFTRSAGVADETPTDEAPGRSEVPTADVMAKADLTKRFLAALIDGGLSFVVGFVPVIGGLAAAAYMLLRDGLDLEFMDGRSIGKKVMKLRPVRLDGQPMDPMASAKRNWMFALGGVTSLLLFIPFIGWLLMIPVVLAAMGLGILEVFLVITDDKGRRFGDKTAGSQVVEVAE